MTRPLEVRLARILKKVDQLIVERDAAIAAKEATERRQAARDDAWVDDLAYVEAERNRLEEERSRLSAELAEWKSLHARLLADHNTYVDGAARREAAVRSELSATVARAATVAERQREACVVQLKRVFNSAHFEGRNIFIAVQDTPLVTDAGDRKQDSSVEVSCE